MANKAYQKIYTELTAITKATVALKASGVSNDELALVEHLRFTYLRFTNYITNSTSLKA